MTDTTDIAHSSDQNKQQIKDVVFGDLSSSSAGKGASLVGLEDASNGFSGSNVEAALTELNDSLRANTIVNDYFKYTDGPIVNALFKTIKSSFGYSCRAWETGNKFPIPEIPVFDAGVLNNVYIDPTGLQGDGTFTTPFNGLPALQIGKNYLFKRGTTYPAAIVIGAVAETATESQPLVFGVYDEVSGARISGVRGAATVNAVTASVISSSYGTFPKYVCIDGLKVTGANNSQWGAINLVAAKNCQIVNCDAGGSTGPGIRLVNCSFVHVDNNLLLGCGNLGISVEGSDLTFSLTTGLVITRNTGTGSTSGFLKFGPYFAGFTYQYCVIAGNSFDNSGTSGAGAHGFWCAGGQMLSCLIYSNHFRRTQGHGCVLQSWDDNSADFTGVKIFDNDFCENAFGVHLVNIRHALIEGNRLNYNGSRDRGLTASNPSTNYGRGIEIVGGSVSRPSAYNVVRYNETSHNYNFISNGTEGVGITSDNWTHDNQIYANLVVGNEGDGIQCYTAYNLQIFGNFCFNNWNLPTAGRGGTYNWYGKSNINMNRVYNSRIWNNTLICGQGTHQRVGFSETTVDSGNDYSNNLIIGAQDAGLAQASASSTLIKRYNVYENCANAETRYDTAQPGTAIALGTGSVVASAGSSGVGALYPYPVLGGPCDNSGDPARYPTALFNGIAPARVPIGAFFKEQDTDQFLLTWTQQLKSVSINGNADKTLLCGIDSFTQVWSTTLTANRTVTLSPVGAHKGAYWDISRPAAGAFNLNVGTGPLKALAAGQWCRVEFNGSAWVLTQFGSL